MSDPTPLLVRQAIDGDRLAFGHLIERFWNRLVSVGRSIVGEGDAEDAAQEAFLVAWQRLDQLKRPEAFEAWLTRITVHSCFERRPQQVAPLAAVTEPSYRTDPGSGIDVERLLSSLPAQQRAVMHLTAVEGRSDSEIGAILDIAPASVRAHRRRARETLRRLIPAPSDREKAQREPSGQDLGPGQTNPPRQQDQRQPNQMQGHTKR